MSQKASPLKDKNIHVREYGWKNNLKETREHFPYDCFHKEDVASAVEGYRQDIDSGFGLNTQQLRKYLKERLKHWLPDVVDGQEVVVNGERKIVSKGAKK